MTPTNRKPAKSKPAPRSGKHTASSADRAEKKGKSDWVLGPYGDLMSRADYDAMMERMKKA